MEYPLIHVIFCSPSLSGSGNTRAFEPVPGWNPQQVIIKILDEVDSTHSEKSGAILDPKNMFRQINGSGLYEGDGLEEKGVIKLSPINLQSKI